MLPLKRYVEAQPIFKRLAEKYPGEPKAQGGYAEACFEAALSEHGEHEIDAICEVYERELAAAGEGFADSAEGQYLAGRAAEVRRDWQLALDHFGKARELNPAMRRNLFHLGLRAERCGLDLEALVAYQQLASLAPVELPAMMNLGIKSMFQSRLCPWIAARDSTCPMPWPAWTCTTTRIRSARKTA